MATISLVHDRLDCGQVRLNMAAILYRGICDFYALFIGTDFVRVLITLVLIQFIFRDCPLCVTHMLYKTLRPTTFPFRLYSCSTYYEAWEYV